MALSITYTKVQLCHYNFNLSKDWFVHFDITNLGTGETKRKQFRGGINYYNDKESHLKEGNALKRFWKERLKNGWHPWQKHQQAVASKEFSRMPLNEAMDFALEKCVVAKKTRSGYTSTLNFSNEAATALGLANRPVEEIERPQIKLILEYIKKSREWSNAAYNKNLGYLGAILSQLIEYNALKFNPAHKIKPLPVVETEKYVPLSDAEKEKLREYLFRNHYRFFVYLMVLYHTGIRPKEILALRIRDIDLEEGLITILPDMEAENSKTKNIRKVPVNNHLSIFLRELQLHKYPSDYYVFGSPFPAGGNRGSQAMYGKPMRGTDFKTGKSGAMRDDYFLPSRHHIKRDTVTKLWKKIIIDKLGIDKHQYALKHTGANDKILAGIDLDALRELYGHSSKLMTEKYARRVKEVYRAQIIEKSPSF